MLIPNFPADLLNQHHQWHQPGAHGPIPLRLHPMGSKGGGIEFLLFHRDFIAQAMSWYNVTQFEESPFANAAKKAALVAPWTSVPPEMTQIEGWSAWTADAVRLDAGAPNFDSDDDLGFFIESGIHNNFLHGAAALAFNDPSVRDFHSPLSTYFYKIHGLVQHWWSSWQRRNLVHRDKKGPKLYLRDLLFHDSVDPDREVPRLAVPFELPKRFRDLTHREVLGLDPHRAQSLAARVDRLEVLTFPMRATFIEANERPTLGDEVLHGIEHLKPVR
ncbi:MAG: hypothetical protein EOO73_10770 [Myxococcales bacterium]|nr:MAG: hypothetical protein EOO73_10770 [Myxococcales bacterium]